MILTGLLGLVRRAAPRLAMSVNLKSVNLKSPREAKNASKSFELISDLQQAGCDAPRLFESTNNCKHSHVLSQNFLENDGTLS